DESITSFEPRGPKRIHCSATIQTLVSSPRARGFVAPRSGWPGGRGVETSPSIFDGERTGQIFCKRFLEILLGRQSLGLLAVVPVNRAVDGVDVDPFQRRARGS